MYGPWVNSMFAAILSVLPSGKQYTSAALSLLKDAAHENNGNETRLLYLLTQYEIG